MDHRLTIQDGLWASDSWVLPRLQEDQTLYSWCAVYHNASGRIDAGTTSRHLFGHADAAFLPDLPSRLGFFHLATQGHLGEPDDVARTRTLAGYLSPFLPEDRYQKLISAMKGDRPGAIKAELGLSRSRIITSRVFKACPDCMQGEFSRLGYAYWHAEHQWPSVAICGQHHVLLWRFEPIKSGKHGRGFHQPREIDTSSWIRPGSVSPDAEHSLLSLLNWSRSLVAAEKLHLDEDLLRWTYLLRSKQRSWTTFDGTLRLQKLKEAFNALYREIAALPGLTTAAETNGPNAGFLGGMFRQVVGLRNPLKHLLVLNFLFDSPDDFMKTYADHLAVRRQDGVEALFKSLTDSRSKLKGWIEAQIMSVNMAAQKLAMPTSQAIKYLDKVGLQHERRPRIVGTETEMKLRDLLSKGIERGIIAKELSIRPTFIKDYLAVHADLEQSWAERRFMRRQAQYRENFLRILGDNPGIPIKQIRTILGNGFQWLYNHDMEWLRSVLPAIWRRP